jgi:hypothetical protein
VVPGGKIRPSLYQPAEASEFPSGGFSSNEIRRRDKHIEAHFYTTTIRKRGFGF